LFLLRASPGLLRTRRVRRGRPLWLFGGRQELRREPRGAVLRPGPADYPLLLPGAQAPQAPAAGNRGCAKPAPGAAAPLLEAGGRGSGRRRVCARGALGPELLAGLLAQLPPGGRVRGRVAGRWGRLLEPAERDGGRIAARNPAVLADAGPGMALLQEDVFAP